MKLHVFRIILFITFSTQAQHITKVLFIGNSLTYFNSMPETFETIANELGDSTEVTVYAPGGTGFVHHVADSNVYHYFKQGDWDYIVLQPGSNESPGYSFPIQETLDKARILKDSIEAYNPCAKVLYYEISYGVWGNTPGHITTYNETMDLIKTNITLLADSTNAFFAPVGEAFRTSWNMNSNNLLWGSAGDIHPNDKGSYMAACVFYASIFQNESVNTSITNSIPVNEALFYRELADSIVLNHTSDWRINTFELYVDYSYLQNGNSIQFNNTTLNADSVIWDFGDGHYSNTFEPQHQYLNNGIYQTTLIAFKGECMDSITQTIEIIGLDINNHESISNYIISPNPTSDVFNIKNITNNEEVRCRIFDLNGNLHFQFSGSSIDVSGLSHGAYFVEINDGRLTQYLKWIKI